MAHVRHDRLPNVDGARSSSPGSLETSGVLLFHLCYPGCPCLLFPALLHRQGLFEPANRLHLFLGSDAVDRSQSCRRGAERQIPHDPPHSSRPAVRAARFRRPASSAQRLRSGGACHGRLLSVPDSRQPALGQPASDVGSPYGTPLCAYPHIRLARLLHGRLCHRIGAEAHRNGSDRIDRADYDGGVARNRMAAERLSRSERQNGLLRPRQACPQAGHHRLLLHRARPFRRPPDERRLPRARHARARRERCACRGGMVAVLAKRNSRPVPAWTVRQPVQGASAACHRSRYVRRALFPQRPHRGSVAVPADAADAQRIVRHLFLDGHPLCRDGHSRSIPRFRNGAVCCRMDGNRRRNQRPRRGLLVPASGQRSVFLHRLRPSLDGIGQHPRHPCLFPELKKRRKKNKAPLRGPCSALLEANPPKRIL
ncbi:hypothetical protein BN871_GJ_00080 [Paenibacillus sp. P22]|nr:hypothetical protein BN871_GJ_00080 [Paenibacillus sp. P22]